LLKFTLAVDCFTESIVSQVVLKLYCVSGTPRGGRIISAVGSWAEDAVTWYSAPFPPSYFTDDLGRARKRHWVGIDVTSAITSMESYRIKGVHTNAAVYSS